MSIDVKDLCARMSTTTFVDVDRCRWRHLHGNGGRPSLPTSIDVVDDIGLAHSLSPLVEREDLEADQGAAWQQGLQRGATAHQPHLRAEEARLRSPQSGARALVPRLHAPAQPAAAPLPRARPAGGRQGRSREADRRMTLQRRTGELCLRFIRHCLFGSGCVRTLGSGAVVYRSLKV